MKPLFQKIPGSARLWAMAALCLAVILAWGNSLTLGFVVDDHQNILENPSIRSLWDLPAVLAGSWESGIAGRPVANLSFAVNWAISGPRPWSYHAANLLIHLLAALTLFSILCRTFRLPRLSGRYGAQATPLAFAAALLWAIHPLNTEAVTYVTQRLECLMGLFFLLVLYGAIRSLTDERPGRWRAFSAMALFLGAGTKENIVAAPLAVLLFDAVLARGGWREALSRDRRLFLGYLPGLAFLGFLLAVGHTVETALAAGKSYTSLSYALTQPAAVAHYLRLAFFPSGLMASAPSPPLSPLFPGAEWAFFRLGPFLLVGGLLLFTGFLVAKRKATGVPLGCFFLTLAPTSSFLPLFCPVAERRMYLPLAALAVLAALAGREAMIRAGTRRARTAVILALILAAAALGAATHLRNRDYRSSLTLWEDAIREEPENAWIRLNLAVELLKDGRTDRALAEFRQSVAEAPWYGEARRVYGTALIRLGRQEEGIAELEEAVRLDPMQTRARTDLGLALAGAREWGRAAEHLRAALALGDRRPNILKNLGRSLAEGGDPRAAIEPLALAAKTDPGDGDTLYMLGSALARNGRWPEAAEAFRKAGALLPGNARPLLNEGMALARAGDREGAMKALGRALEIRPDLAPGHRELGLILIQEDRLPEATERLSEALRLDPGDRVAGEALARIRPEAVVKKP